MGPDITCMKEKLQRHTYQNSVTEPRAYFWNLGICLCQK